MQLPTLDNDHRYWLDGREVPGVTSILEAAGLIDRTWVSQYGLDRGTAVHDAVLFSNEGDLDESSLDPAVLPYLQQYRRFMAITKATVINGERIVYSKTRDYAGRYDLLLNYFGQVTLVDIKTNHKPKWVESQLGLYSFALRESGVHVNRVGCLELFTDHFNVTTWDTYQAEADGLRTLGKAREVAA